MTKRKLKRHKLVCKVDLVMLVCLPLDPSPMPTLVGPCLLLAIVFSAIPGISPKQMHRFLLVFAFVHLINVNKKQLDKTKPKQSKTKPENVTRRYAPIPWSKLRFQSRSVFSYFNLLNLLWTLLKDLFLPLFNQYSTIFFLSS